MGESVCEEYHVNRLVYFELYADLPTAIAREKQINKWRRARKVELIEGNNPRWQDLWGRLFDCVAGCFV